MRKSRTVHLEEDFWREMDDYKERNTCGSRNTALERMLLERRMLIGLVQQLGLSGAVGAIGQSSFGASAVSSQPPIQAEEPPKPKPKEDKKALAKQSVLQSSMSTMRDE